MGINQRCPRCGGEKVQLKDTINQGCLWLALLGPYYVLWLMFKWLIGVMIFICFDWWMAIVKGRQDKEYVWHSKKFFVRRKNYYCHDCGYNFKA